TIAAIWYFAPEMVIGWLALGYLLYSATLRIRIKHLLLAVVAATMLTVNMSSHGFTIDVRLSSIGNPFVRAARWMEMNLPIGSRVGTLSSGYVSYFAPSEQVVNLDGLMNDTDYFESYLKTGKVAQYIRRQDIAYFADYRDS